jgi:hypothetical protein
VEVEFRFKSEMDRLMKRNQEVHEESTRLEEEMGEMEKTLIETKMMYAEVCSSPKHQSPILSLGRTAANSMNSQMPNMKLYRGNGMIFEKRWTEQATLSLIFRTPRCYRHPTCTTC